jgi:hypothetical protein
MSRAGEIADAGGAQLVDGRADLLQRDAGVEEALDELEDEDVAEAVQTLRSRPAGSAHGRLDQFGARPVVELAIGDAGGPGGDGAAVADLVVHLRQAVGEQQLGPNGVRRGPGRVMRGHRRLQPDRCVLPR